MRLSPRQLAELARLVPLVGVGATAKRLKVQLRTVTRWAAKLDLPRPTRPSRAETDARSAALLWAEATGA